MSDSPDGDSSPSPPPPPTGDSSPSPPPPSEDNSSPSPPPPSSPSPSPPPPDNSDSPSPPPPPNNNESSNQPSPPPPPPRSTQPDKVFSPPPPVRNRLSPTPRGSSNSKSSSDSGDITENMASIVGVAAGFGLLLLIIILIVIACARRKKRSEVPIHYFTHHASDDKYYKRQAQATGPNQYGYNNGEQAVNIPPLPPNQWHSSGDMSNSSYSGPVLPPPHPSVALGFNQSTFTYEELSAATGGFSQHNLLGQGGFGYVHKGVLPNGKEIAVKSLKSTGGQGDREFQAEVEIISRVHHRHLVSLVGYCISDSSRKILVYEFVPNKTLEYHLHGSI